jgi:hypothetical protein
MDNMVSCFSMLLLKNRPTLPLTNGSESNEQSDVSTLTPGAYSFIPQLHSPKPYDENLTLDLNELKKQYKRLTERQHQACIIIKNANEQHSLKVSKERLSLSVTDPSTPTIRTTTYMKKGKYLESLDDMSPDNSIYNHLLFKTNNNNSQSVNDSVFFKYTDKSIDHKSMKKPLKKAEFSQSDGVFDDTIEDVNLSSNHSSPVIKSLRDSTSTKHPTTENLTKHSNTQQKQAHFNPLKTKPFNASIAKNGIRLGLYK